MKVTVTSPATIMEMAELSGAMTRLHWQIAKEMWHAGDTYALHAGEQLLAIAGFYPLTANDDYEAWFCPGPLASAHMTGVALATRLTFRAAPYRSIVTVCTTENGKRIARFAGMRFAADTDLGEVWAYGQSDYIDFRRRQRSERGTGAGAAGEPAPDAGAAGGPAG